MFKFFKVYIKGIFISILLLNIIPEILLTPRQLTLRRVRDTLISKKLEEAFSVLSLPESTANERRNLLSEIKQVYFNYDLGALSVSDRVKFILNVFNPQGFPLLHDLLEELRDKYELMSFKSEVLSPEKQWSIEKWIGALKEHKGYH